jgi:hypothetical protein
MYPKPDIGVQVLTGNKSVLSRMFILTTFFLEGLSK